MTDKKAEILDLRGLKCPLPVLRAKKAMKPMPGGHYLWLETTDPMAAIDIPAFCNEDGHTLEKTETMEDCQRFLVRKADG